MRRQQKSGGAFGAAKDHVTTHGFINDGYDYSQHMQEMGGGHFIGRDGKTRDISSMATANNIALPADLLPSEGQLDRHFDSITISAGMHCCCNPR